MEDVSLAGNRWCRSPQAFSARQPQPLRHLQSDRRSPSLHRKAKLDSCGARRQENNTSTFIVHASLPAAPQPGALTELLPPASATDGVEGGEQRAKHHPRVPIEVPAAARRLRRRTTKSRRGARPGTPATTHDQNLPGARKGRERHGTTKVAASMASMYMHIKCAQKCRRHFANNQFLSHRSEAEWQMEKSSRNPCQPSKCPRKFQKHK